MSTERGRASARPLSHRSRRREARWELNRTLFRRRVSWSHVDPLGALLWALENCQKLPPPSHIIS
eukprot:scaffold180217_cov34-Tisochrysis_lutea.AAC.3